MKLLSGIVIDITTLSDVIMVMALNLDSVPRTGAGKRGFVFCWTLLEAVRLARGVVYSSLTV
jgi:hypothetical protein